jgi:hypothetical protein
MHKFRHKMGWATFRLIFSKIVWSRVARFFWHNIPKRGKIYQITATLPNGHKIYQMTVCKTLQITIKYTSIFYSKVLQNLPKLGFLVWKQTIWQPWSDHPAFICTSFRHVWHRNVPGVAALIHWKARWLLRPDFALQWVTRMSDIGRHTGSMYCALEHP